MAEEGGDNSSPSEETRGNPFTEADIQRIFDEEKADGAQEGWQQMKQTPDLEIWRKKVPDVDIHLVKVSQSKTV